MSFVTRSLVVAGLIVWAAGVSHAETAGSSRVEAGPPNSPRVLPQASPSTPAAEITMPAPSADVPEPKQWVLLLAGLSAIGWVARRRR